MEFLYPIYRVPCGTHVCFLVTLIPLCWPYDVQTLSSYFFLNIRPLRNLYHNSRIRCARDGKHAPNSSVNQVRVFLHYPPASIDECRWHVAITSSGRCMAFACPLWWVGLGEIASSKTDALFSVYLSDLFQDCLFLFPSVSSSIQGLRDIPAVCRFRFVPRIENMPLNTDCATIAIVIQRLVYGNPPPPTALLDDEDLEQALALAEE